MKDALSMVASVRRPKLLIRAARHGQAEYNRETHLPRVLSYGRIPRPGEAVMLLLEREALVNEARKVGAASYSLVRHVDLLIALMGEAHLLRASQSDVA